MFSILKRGPEGPLWTPLWVLNHEGSRSYAAKYASVCRWLLLGRWCEISRAAEDWEGFWGVLGVPLDAQMTGVVLFSFEDVSERRPSFSKGRLWPKGAESRGKLGPRGRSGGLSEGSWGTRGPLGSALRAPEEAPNLSGSTQSLVGSGWKEPSKAARGHSAAPRGYPRIIENRVGAPTDLALSSSRDS